MTYRGAVNEFHYSSAGAIAGEYFVASVGTTGGANLRKTIRITDLKATCATAATIQIIGKGADILPQGLDFDLPANGSYNFSWITPYKMSLVSSTTAAVGFVASASGTGVKYSVSGFID